MDKRARRAEPDTRADAPRPRPATFATPSGVTVPATAGPPADTERIGWPGLPPYTRGIHPTMYRARLWTMRQYAGFGAAHATNERFHYLLQQGVTGLSLAFDLPTQLGLDSDDPPAAGEVGRVGVAIDTIEDMATVFDGIPLGEVSTSMTINAPAAGLLMMYAAAARRQGVPLSSLRGTVQNDILKEYMARGTYIFPPGPSMRLTVDLIEHCLREMPRWNPISISGYHIREAGATAVQELAFTLADARAYVQACVERGLAVDAFAPRLSFFFNAHNDLFEEVAKFRAARRLWCRMLQDEFGAREPDSLRLRFHAQTAGSSLTAQQPLNNVVRVTVQALAAILGGCQSLHTNSYDEALALPTEQAARIALRTQQVVAHESGATNTIDPLGGSHYLEWLTDELEARATELMKRIDAMGGMLCAIERGWVQKEIHDSAYRTQEALERDEIRIVGVNAYTTQESAPVELHRSDPRIEADMRERLTRHRRGRDAAAVETSLAHLREQASGDTNIVAGLLEAFENGATLGEAFGALRSVWGEHREVSF